MPQIYVQNKSNHTISAFVSKFNGGGDTDWYTLNPQEGDKWTRDSEGWELVAFRVGESMSPTSRENRGGIYVKLGSTVQFFDVDDIRVI